MNIYLISQEENNGYDTYDSAVVVAPDEETAKTIDPHDGGIVVNWPAHIGEPPYLWCSSPDKVDVELIGKAEEGTPIGVILSSFNAG